MGVFNIYYSDDLDEIFGNRQITLAFSQASSLDVGGKIVSVGDLLSRVNSEDSEYSPGHPPQSFCLVNDWKKAGEFDAYGRSLQECFRQCCGSLQTLYLTSVQELRRQKRIAYDLGALRSAEEIEAGFADAP